MKTIVKRELANRIAEKFNISNNKALKIVQTFLDEILKELQMGNRIELRNFGVFEIKKRKSRKARNPRTGEEVIIPERNVVILKPGKNMKPLGE